MTIQMQEEQKCSSCFLTELQQLAGKGDSMAKFLNYEDRLEIESGLKVSAKYCYAIHELRLHQNDRCKRFTLV